MHLDFMKVVIIVLSELLSLLPYSTNVFILKDVSSHV